MGEHVRMLLIVAWLVALRLGDAYVSKPTAGFFGQLWRRWSGGVKTVIKTPLAIGVIVKSGVGHWLYSDGTMLPIMAGGAPGGITLTPENVRVEIEKEEAAAKQLFADAEKVKADMVEAGVNPMTDADAFETVDAAYKAYDLKKNEVGALQSRLDRLAEIDGISTPGAAGRRPSGGADVVSIAQRALTPGQRFVRSAEYQALDAAGAFVSDASFQSALAGGLDRPVEVLSRDELKALLDGVPQIGAATVTGGGATSAGPFIQNDLIPGFVAYARKRPVLAGMVGNGETDSDVVEYVTQSAPTDAGAETAEDMAAPESTYAFATQTTNVREITHFVPVTKRAMADHGQIATIIENELGLGALDRLDTQLATGDGAGQNLTGIYNASGIGDQDAAGLGKAEALRKAMTIVRIAAGVLSEPDFIGIHPSDLEAVQLETDANGNYIYGPPNSAGPTTAWGIPLRSSTVFTSGQPLVGDYGGSSRLWLREALAVTSGLDGNDFTQRRVSLLAALRVAFAVTRAGGFATVSNF